MTRLTINFRKILLLLKTGTFVNPALGIWRQEGQKFMVTLWSTLLNVSLGYMRPCLHKKKKKFYI